MTPWIAPPPGPLAVQALSAVGGVVLAGSLGVGVAGLLRRGAQGSGAALGRRMATLVGLAVVVFTPAYLGGAVFAALVTLLAGIALGEFYAACAQAGFEADRRGGLLAGAGLVVVGAILGPAWLGPGLALATVALATAGLRRVDETLIARTGATMLGVAYVGLLFAFLPALRAMPGGFGWLVFFLMTVQLADVGALVGGLALGRRKLAPVLSPGKTWEGAACGLLAAAAAGAGFAFALPGVPIWAAAASGLVLAVAGLFGDLAASAFKRAAGLKDFGGLLPGHGGILDRFDSYLFAAPVAYAIASMFSLGL